MKRNALKWVFLLFLLIFPFPMIAQNYQELWEKIEEQQRRDLPESVLRSTEEILRLAEKERNFPQMLKAYLYRASFRQSISRDSISVDVRFLRDWAEKEKDPVRRAILNLALGDLYKEASGMAVMDDYDFGDKYPEDMTEWTRGMFERQQWKAYERAFCDVPSLAKAKVFDYELLIKQGKDSELYDHDLLSSALLYVIEGRYIEDVGFQTARKLFDKVIAYYEQAGKQDAMYLMKLRRAVWLFQSGYRDENNYYYNFELLGDSLRQWITEAKGKQVAPYLYQGWLEQIRQDSMQYVLSKEALAAYPHYRYADFFRSTLEDCSGTWLSMLLEEQPLPQHPLKINMTYRSVPEIKYWVKMADEGRIVDKGTIHLASGIPYQKTDTVVCLNPLPHPGRYQIEMQVGKERKKLFINYTTLYPLVRQLPDKRWQVFVLDCLTGRPIEGAQVEMMRSEFDRGVRRLISLEKKQTGQRGSICFEQNEARFYIQASKEGFGQTDTISFYNMNRNSRSTEEKDFSVSLFTDRAIYRPGQTVQISGMVVGGKQHSFWAEAGKKVTLEIKDSNRQTLYKEELTSNEMGSFSTRYTLPENFMPGTVYIRCGNRSITCLVEEYKRPIFEVTLLPLKTDYSFGDTVYVEGTALNYSGTPVVGAEVQYKYEKRRYVNTRVTDADVSGRVQTDENGYFRIPVYFETSNEVDYDRFHYNMEVSVTNPAGETQTANRSYKVSKQSLDLYINESNYWVKENLDSVVVHVENCDNQPIDIEGEIQVCPIETDEGKEDHMGDPVYTMPFFANRTVGIEGFKHLPSGSYCILLKVKNKDGLEIKEEFHIVLFSMNDRRSPVKKALWHYADGLVFTKEKPVKLLLGTSAKHAYLLYDVFAKEKHLESRCIELSDTLLTVTFGDKPEYRDGIQVQWAMVQEGKEYEGSIYIAPKQPDLDLRMKWETFRDRLRPGDAEEWRLKILMPDGKPADAELLATLYDASLDQYRQLYWTLLLPYREWNPRVTWRNYLLDSLTTGLFFRSKNPYRSKNPVFDRWMIGYMLNRAVYLMFNVAENSQDRAAVMQKEFTKPVLASNSSKEDMVLGTRTETVGTVLEEMVVTKSAGASSKMRSDFSETAFFYPHIRTDENGIATIAFTLPESLTTWNFKGLAHTKDMYYGEIDTCVVANKEFMLQPQLPRFMRVGDKTVLSATITNRSNQTVEGTVRMELFDPQSEKCYVAEKESFRVEANGTTVVSFEVTMDEALLLACRMTADGGIFSDGEQRYLPVLTDREWITESQTVSINKAGRYEINLDKLFNQNSRTATERRLTVEYADNPVWYAVMALPSVGNPSQEDAISLVSAYYALRLGGWIVKSYPRIQEVCEAWKAQGGDGETLWSQLQKNKDLKNILLEETPWLREANSEAEQRRMLTTFFDLNSLQSRVQYYLSKLEKLQRADGSWSWYQGMDGSRYVTTYVLETLLRLNKLMDGQYVNEWSTLVNKGMDCLNAYLKQEYERMKKAEAKGDKNLYPSEMAVHCMYLQALWKDESKKEKSEMQIYFLDKLADMSPQMTIFGKAVAAYTFQRAGYQTIADTYLQSLLEYTVSSPEMGRYYDTNLAYYSWADYRIPTQTAVIEVCRDMGVADSIVSEMQQWLLKQKQVQAWSNPLNSVNAIYAILNGREKWLEATDPVQLKLDGKPVVSSDPVSALGYVKHTYVLDEKKKVPRKLVVEQTSDHPSWGAVYAQYLEQLDKVNKHATGLSVERQLLVRRLVEGKEKWIEVTSDERLKVGDRVRSRLIVHADRDMDFVQVEDKRASCMEPGVMLSGYQWSSGTGCYRVIKDTSIRYFADRLSKGVHIFETEYTLTAPGVYRMGLASIQSAYTPEFNAHSASMELSVVR